MGADQDETEHATDRGPRRAGWLPDGTAAAYVPRPKLSHICIRDPLDRTDAEQATSPLSGTGLNQREPRDELISGRCQPKQARTDEQGYERGHYGDGRQHDRQLKPAARNLQPVVAVVALVLLRACLFGQLLHAVLARLGAHPVGLASGGVDALANLGI